MLSLDKRDIKCRYFDGGCGSGYLARVIGMPKRRSLVYVLNSILLEALDMSWINTVVPWIK